MYLPRSLLSTLYLHLQRTHHPLSPPVLILVALEPDALCGCRILTHLLKHDYIPHKIQPIAGFNDLERAGRENVRPMLASQGGSGGVVVCLGVGARNDLGAMLGIDAESEGEGAFGGVEVWVVDAQRQWHLENVFGGAQRDGVLEDGSPGPIKQQPGVDNGKIGRGFKPGKGGIIVFDDGDIEEELGPERAAYFALDEMPAIDERDDEGDSESEEDEDTPMIEARPGQKRKSWSDREDDESDEDYDRPRQRRRSNSSSPIPESPSRPQRRGLMIVDGPNGVTRSDSRSVSPSPAQPAKQVSSRTLRRRLIKLQQKNQLVLDAYYSLGTSYSEPIASMMYSLASELGREDNDVLWLTIVGVSSMELYGRSGTGVAISLKNSSNRSGWRGSRGSRIRQLLREEVRRLNPPDLNDRAALNSSTGLIPTTACSPTDTSIRLSPEPKFLLIRHWSLYDSMLHSPYLSARLHVWTDVGRKRLHKMLAKMGVSLVQCKQSYTHMDMDLKRGLRGKLLKYSAMYGLDELVPPAESDEAGGDKEGWGFVRSWGWRATLSAQDVGVVVGSILEVGKKGVTTLEDGGWDRGREVKEITDENGEIEAEEWVSRFWDAYDALENIEELKAALPTAQHLHRAILRTGTSIIEKRQIKHLSSFRLCIVKDGPDVALFTHPSALTKLALWLGEAFAEQDLQRTGKLGMGGRGTPLVVACWNAERGVYGVVGTGGGGGEGMSWGDREAARKRKEEKAGKAKEREAARKVKETIREQKREAKRKAREEEGEIDELETESESESEEEEDDEDEDEEDEKEHGKGFGRNRFGNAFQEVIEETNARIRVDSFEHCVAEVAKDSLSVFLEGLSMKNVVG
ncbi:hypothetical protein VE03_04351 [Pseudogymnoascus sp. 23342-1-I1]|nr:hypothetical protein VE03_04351 [Pseudogymnoascus sp. 23342-1-I1]